MLKITPCSRVRIGRISPVDVCTDMASPELPPVRRGRPGLATLRALAVAAIGALAFAAQAAIPAGERQVLLDIYNSTNGAAWVGVTPAWTSAAGSECTWGGVTCNAGQTAVIEINLSVRNLVGPLPASLNQLAQLQYLTADGNRLSGSIPALTGMTALRGFNVARNQLDGSIGSLAGLTVLEQFQASANRLSGSIPALSGLAALRSLYLDQNRLTGAIPSFTGLSNLQQVSLYRNTLSGSIPALTGLGALTYFDVRTNQLTGSLPSLAGLTGLQQVLVTNNQLSGALPSVPSPNNLTAGNSQLCPNAFTVSADAAWDAATGVTPWSRDCSFNYTITPVTAANGSIFPALPQQVGQDGVVVFDIIPNAGYGVIVGGTCRAGTFSGTSYSLVFPNANCTVAPTFSNAQYSVTISSSGNGMVTPTGVQTVLFGTFVAFTATPDPGFRASAQTTCGGVNGFTTNGNQFTTSAPVSGNCTITVSFTAIVPQFAVTPAAGAHGRISPATVQQITQGGRTEFAVTPDAGYAIAAVTGCGGTLVGNTYTTGPVTAACTVSATFVLLAVAAQPVPVDGVAALIALMLLIAVARSRRVWRTAPLHKPEQ